MSDLVCQWDYRQAGDVDKFQGVVKELEAAMATLPAKGNVWALLSRTPVSDGLTGSLLLDHMPEAGEALALMVEKDRHSFSIYKFLCQGIVIGLRLTITDVLASIGKSVAAIKGTHFLLAPNDFDDAVNSKLQFLRAMDAAAENQG